MNKYWFFLVFSVLGFNSHAQSQTATDNREVMVTYCKIFGEVGRMAMIQRQSGVSMAKAKSNMHRQLKTVAKDNTRQWGKVGINEHWDKIIRMGDETLALIYHNNDFPVQQSYLEQDKMIEDAQVGTYEYCMEVSEKALQEHGYLNK